MKVSLCFDGALQTVVVTVIVYTLAIKKLIKTKKQNMLKTWKFTSEKSESFLSVVLRLFLLCYFILLNGINCFFDNLFK